MECQSIIEDGNNETSENACDPWSDDIQAEKLQQIVSIQSEESIHNAATSHINEVLSRFKKTDQNNSFDTKTADAISNESHVADKVELDRRVRIGEITPFQKLSIKSSKETLDLSSLEQYMKRQADLAAQHKKLKSSKAPQTSSKEVPKHKCVNTKKHVPLDKLKQSRDKKDKTASTDANEKPQESFIEQKTSEREENTSVCKKRSFSSDPGNRDSGSEYLPSDGELEESDVESQSRKVKQTRKKRRKNDTDGDHEDAVSSVMKILDDGDESIYRERMEEKLEENSTKKSLYTVENLFKVPKSIWKNLYEYQRVSVRWLWELHGRDQGGLLGDEMGLGKTVQVIAFLAGLDVSELLSDGGRFRGLGPTLIVCPATLLEQWVKHFRDWSPSFRVVVLHHSGTFRGEPECLIESIMKTGGIVVTSYTGVLRNKNLLVKSEWHYVILDEGHKIRNPDAKVSKAVKQFSTPHRLLLTGSPMQNSLKELWSLFDFVLPGKLGTLATFLEHCANPITRGGYANASPLQEATALQVATMLKDAIAPYMLRRTKNDVQHHINLPEKNEQVLFCSLTDEQRNLYKEYLRTDHVSSVLHDRNNSSENSYRARLLVALTNLRKICNHPDLYTYGNADVESDDDATLSEETVQNFGYWKRSGKLAVVRSLLKIWKRQGHRVLLFTQGRQMMHVLEALLQREDYKYLRLDGTTPMSQRQQTIHKFNNDSTYLVFVSTTRVGGLGINLTGANRVVIYDPDWNPAIDAQARERAWRIGQDKRVTVYRLVTAGTVEEKIYHRQIFKLLLSNRVLEDPRQRRLFQTSDLSELFNFNEPLDGTTTESDRIFRDCKLKPNEPNFTPRKIEAMKKLASSVSKRIEKIAKNKDEKEGKPTVGVTSEQITEQCQSSVKHPHKKRKKNKRDETELSATFEGEKVPCLLGRRLGRAEVNEEQVSSTCDDQYVLMKLFSKTKVSSAFQHDAVLSNARSNGHEATPMHRMARDTAQESMDLLRKSRKWCWRPTWDAAKTNDD